MDSMIITGMAIIFLVESFWESRLFMQLTAIMRTVSGVDEEELRRVRSVMRMDRRWNILSWILIIGILFVPSGATMPFICILCLLETVMVMRLDRVYQQYRPS